MFRWITWAFVVTSARAYLEETVAVPSSARGVSDSCLIFGNNSHTTVKFHNDSTTKQIAYSTSIVAVNAECDRVLLGFPELNQVVVWNPRAGTTVTVSPPVNNVAVHRFGFSVDIHRHTWVVGSPGQETDQNGNGATLGYVFVFDDNVYHSCHSQYDSYCFLEDDSCTSGFQAWKNMHNLHNDNVVAFQKQCPPEIAPNYDTGPAEDFDVGRFHKQQFGYDVSITETSLFVSAPGDTRRFLENNDGSNYGRVYVFDIAASIVGVTWRTPSIKSPLEPPPIEGGHYRAYGRSITASHGTLIVSSYPLYHRRQDVFVFVYECNESPSYCEESPRRGIRVAYLRDHTGAIYDALRVHATTAVKAYSDAYSGRSYIAADLDSSLGDVQNDMTGKHVGLAGSNILITDKKNNYVYRFGIDTENRETHSYSSTVAFASASEHWAHSADDTLVHLWPCPRGSTSAKEMCSYIDKSCIANKCIPCQIGYFSRDGWLPDCDWCPQNTTTNEEGQTECGPWIRPDVMGISWEETSTILYAILAVGGACFAFVCICQRCCFSTRRRPRIFV